MLVAAPYTNDTHGRDIPDEYNLKYTNTSTTAKLIDFCKLFVDKRINIVFIDRKIDYFALEQANKIHPDIAVKVMPEHLNEIDELRRRNIKFFFDIKSIPCYSLSLLDAMLSGGISDIYLYDNLCYNMAEVKQRCEEKNIKTRLILNTISAMNPQRGEDPKSPIYCPRDVEEIKQYIDVVEFDCWTDGKYDGHTFNVLYKTGFKKQDGIGDLREINKDLDLFFPHSCYSPGMFSRRFNCGRACVLKNNCSHCQLVFDLAQSLYERETFISIK